MEFQFQCNYIKPQKAFALFGKYSNGNHSLDIYDASKREVLLKASVNPGIELAPNQIAIKNWNEGENVEAALKAAGLIDTHPVQFIRSGDIMVPVYVLGALAMQAIKDQAEQQAGD